MTTKIIDLREAQQNLALLLAHASRGTEFLLMDGDILRARLIPVHPTPSTQRVAGLNQGCIVANPDFDLPLPDSFWLGDE